MFFSVCTFPAYASTAAVAAAASASTAASGGNNLTSREKSIIEEKRRKEAIEKAKQDQMNKTFSAIDNYQKETGYTGEAYKAFSSQDEAKLVDIEQQAFAECMKR